MRSFGLSLQLCDQARKPGHYINGRGRVSFSTAWAGGPVASPVGVQVPASFRAGPQNGRCPVRAPILTRFPFRALRFFSGCQARPCGGGPRCSYAASSRPVLQPRRQEVWWRERSLQRPAAHSLQSVRCRQPARGFAAEMRSLEKLAERSLQKDGPLLSRRPEGAAPQSAGRPIRCLSGWMLVRGVCCSMQARRSDRQRQAVSRPGRCAVPCPPAPQCPAWVHRQKPSMLRRYSSSQPKKAHVGSLGKKSYEEPRSPG